MSPVSPRRTASGLTIAKVRSIELLLALEYRFHRRAEVSRAHRNRDSRRLERRDFIGRSAASALYNRPGVTHPPSLRRGLARDKCDHGFLKVLLYMFGGFFLSRPADFANHDDRARLGVFVEQLERVDMRCADDRVAADPD